MAGGGLPIQHASVGHRGPLLRLSHGKRVKGLLLVITPTTAGKWWFSFETPAQNQSAACTPFAPGTKSALSANTATVVQ